jgi:hypothetical protein
MERSLMNWGIEDVAAAAVIAIAVVAGILAVRLAVHSQPARGLLMTGVVLTALAFWAHLAVGIL